MKFNFALDFCSRFILFAFDLLKTIPKLCVRVKCKEEKKIKKYTKRKKKKKYMRQNERSDTQ